MKFNDRFLLKIEGVILSIDYWGHLANKKVIFSQDVSKCLVNVSAKFQSFLKSGFKIIKQ